MNKIIYILLILIAAVLGFLSSFLIKSPENKEVLKIITVIDKPFEKYSIENLSKTGIKIGEFTEDSDLIAEENYTSGIFRYSFYPAISNLSKTVTGMINRPIKKDTPNSYPIAILFRGYVDQKIYTTGMGSKNFAYFLANNGFITIAVDFLGYAGSDKEAENIFESRFQTYVTALSIIKLVEENKISGWDGKNIFIWGHSNGGQIALTVLETTGKEYPTVLWAPVSKPFPYSVLYYTDESEDRGKLIRSELSKFESLYDVEKYSITNYFANINSPLQIHQGTGDDAVPVSWSDTLVAKLQALDKNVSYIKHANADHNLNPDWNNAAKQSLDFFISKKQ